MSRGPPVVPSAASSGSCAPGRALEAGEPAMQAGPATIRVDGHANRGVADVLEAPVVEGRLQVAGVQAEPEAGDRGEVALHSVLSRLVAPRVLGAGDAGRAVAGAAVAVDGAVERVGLRLVLVVERPVEGAVAEHRAGIARQIRHQQCLGELGMDRGVLRRERELAVVGRGGRQVEIRVGRLRNQRLIHAHVDDRTRHGDPVMRGQPDARGQVEAVGLVVGCIPDARGRVGVGVDDRGHPGEVRVVQANRVVHRGVEHVVVKIAVGERRIEERAVLRELHLGAGVLRRVLNGIGDFIDPGAGRERHRLVAVPHVALIGQLEGPVVERRDIEAHQACLPHVAQVDRLSRTHVVAQ